MAWNDDPLVRDLAAYCKEHKFPIGLFWGISRDAEDFMLVTYGRDAKLCNYAKKLGDRVCKVIFEEPKK